MKYVIPILCALFSISCSSEPQPLAVGKDECYFCKMPYADTKFGAEIITVKRKLYKFDDTGCLINFLKMGFGANEKIKSIFTIDYANNQKLSDVNTSVFIINEKIQTPMNSGIAAFASHDEAETFLKEFPGEILTWQQLQLKLK
jgi:copper chaperone NosL